MPPILPDLPILAGNFSPEGNVMGAGEHLRVVERFTRVARGTIDYEITLADPTTTHPAVLPADER
jgi:hypothetical protein